MILKPVSTPSYTIVRFGVPLFVIDIVYNRDPTSCVLINVVWTRRSLYNENIQSSRRGQINPELSLCHSGVIPT